jgi:hypothetical protein
MNFEQRSSRYIRLYLRTRSKETTTKIAQSAFQLPFSDFQESRVFTKIADFIRKKLNKQFGPDFNVIVGKSFGAFVTHKAKSYMFFSVIPGVFTLVWKS